MEIKFWTQFVRKEVGWIYTNTFFAVKNFYCPSILDQINQHHLWRKICDPPASLMKKDLRTSWKQLLNIKKQIRKNKYTDVTNIYTIKMDKLGNETHLMINTITNIKTKLEYVMIPKDFFPLELLGSALKTKLANCRTC